VLAGSYFGIVRVQGVCFVNHGVATVHGTLRLTAGSALVATFGLNDATGSGNSRLVVDGNLVVEGGAALFLGCGPGDGACIDDPNQANPTLISRGKVTGNLIEQAPLGVVVHTSEILGTVSETGGGGGVNCTPSGAFAVFGSPAYSTYENTSIGGGLNIRGLESCWLGVARDRIGGSALFSGVRLADPDGIEIIANQIRGDLACFDNSMVWNSSEATPGGPLFPRIPQPNTVLGARLGQCVLASPTTPGGPLGPGPF
jgi:hypothetical protein